MLTGYVNRRQIEQDQALSLAWHTEAFARQKKLPSLEKILGRAKARTAKPQSNEEILAAMQAWAAMANESEKEKRPA